MMAIVVVVVVVLFFAYCEPAHAIHQIMARFCHARQYSQTKTVPYTAKKSVAIKQRKTIQKEKMWPTIQARLLLLQQRHNFHFVKMRNSDFPKPTSRPKTVPSGSQNLKSDSSPNTTAAVQNSSK